MLAVIAVICALAFGVLLATDLSAMEKFFGSALIMMLAAR